jgi:CheY-like chemotaxis protein
VAQAVEAVTPAMERARHRLSVQIPEAPAWIDADPARVVQAVTNLLTNAAKYTPDQGEIRLSVRVADGKAHIALVDNGLGIEPADHDRVFEMFTQLPHTGKKAHGGLGIGLSLVKRLVDMHGGAVGVRSAGLNQGSTFWIELPLAAAPQVAAAAPGTRGVVQPKGRVLVVEDNVDGLAALVELIEAEGHAVRGAPDGPRALETAAQWPPDIVLLDLGLPQMDGYEVAARMRQDLGLAQARIVALTGWGTQRDREKTAAAGFDAHLTKPVAPDDLLELLGRWLTP